MPHVRSPLLRATRCSRNAPRWLSKPRERVHLHQYIPDGATVADIGAGIGHYSEVLARRGCRVHVIDVARRLLDTAVERLTRCGLGDQIIDAHHASATDLAFLADESCDAVLLLGPLYNLGDRAERHQAIAEAARVVRHGGLVFAAGINKLAFFRDEFRKTPAGAAERTTLFEGVLRDGNFPPPADGSPSTFHMTTVEEFRTELSATFTPAGSRASHFSCASRMRLELPLQL